MQHHLLQLLLTLVCHRLDGILTPISPQPITIPALRSSTHNITKQAIGCCEQCAALCSQQRPECTIQSTHYLTESASDTSSCLSCYWHCRDCLMVALLPGLYTGHFLSFCRQQRSECVLTAACSRHACSLLQKLRWECPEALDTVSSYKSAKTYSSPAPVPCNSQGARGFLVPPRTS